MLSVLPVISALYSSDVDFCFVAFSSGLFFHSALCTLYVSAINRGPDVPIRLRSGEGQRQGQETETKTAGWDWKEEMVAKDRRVADIGGEGEGLRDKRERKRRGGVWAWAWMHVHNIQSTMR